MVSQYLGWSEKGTDSCYYNNRLLLFTGGPFSALTASMQPLAANERPGEAGQSEDPNSQPEFTWDEFGFRVEEEDGPEDSSNKLLSIPFVESPKVIQVKYLYRL